MIFKTIKIISTMALCDACIFYDGKTCRQPRGAKYGKTIKNPVEWVECEYYLEILKKAWIEW